MIEIKVNKILQDVEEFKKAGFVIEEESNELYKITLPEGWTTEQKSVSNMYLFDNKERYRGCILIENNTLTLSFFSYYSVGEASLNGEKEVYLHHTTFYKSGKLESEKIFTAGTIPFNDEFLQEKTTMLRKKAEKFAEEHYPDYQHMTAYWDDEEKTLEKPKVYQKKNNL